MPEAKKAPAKKRTPPKPKITVVHDVHVEVPVQVHDRYSLRQGNRGSKDSLSLRKDGDNKVQASVACRQDIIVIPLDLLTEALAEIGKKVVITDA